MPRLNVNFALSAFTSLGRIDFEAGFDASGTGIAAGDVITQTTGGAEGIAMYVVLSNGSWAAGDAEGYMIFQTTSTNTFDVSGTGIEIVNEGTAEVLPTIVDMDGRFDGRFSNARYYVALEHTPDSLPTGEYAMLLDWHLAMHIPNATTGVLEVLGFNLQTDDVIQIPIASSNGRRVEMRYGQFVVFGFWDDSEGKLIIYIVFQGIDGLGAGSTTSIQEFCMSLAQDTCGDWVAIDLDDVTFVFSYDTNDTGAPTPPPDPGSPFSLGGGNVFEQ